MEETGQRKFVLYVCETQDAANAHVVNIAQILEDSGVKPLLSEVHGRTRGWRMDLLRTAPREGETVGFNVLAYGLDSVRRGIKIGQFRPDLIILDDIDNLNDSAAAALKKLNTITKTILPVGSTHSAVCFIQNPIHGQSVMSRLLRGEVRSLNIRTGCRNVPCIKNLKYTEGIENGQFLYRVLSGVPSWVGFSLKDAEHWLNELGSEAFLTEFQNEINASGLMFPYFMEKRNGLDWHVTHSSNYPIQEHWRIIGSHDYGESAKNDTACSLIAAQDEWGDIYIIGEVYMSGWTSERQAHGMLRLAYSLGLAQPIDPKNVYGKWQTRFEDIAMDWAGTFPNKNASEQVKTEYPVQKWWDLGLPVSRADKDRIAGWRKCNEWFGAPRAYVDMYGVIRWKARIIIFGDRCPNLVRLLRLAPPSEKDPIDLDPTYEDHPLDALRYLLMSVMEEPMKPVNRYATAYNRPENDPLSTVEQELAMAGYEE